MTAPLWHEEVLDHAVLGTPEGTESREFVEVRDGETVLGWWIKRYGGAVPWSLFERRGYRDRRTAFKRWYEGVGGRTLT